MSFSIVKILFLDVSSLILSLEAIHYLQELQLIWIHQERNIYCLNSIITSIYGEKSENLMLIIDPHNTFLMHKL